MELRRGTFHINLDGETIGSIDRHQTFETPIQPSHHELQLQIGRCFSSRRSFDVADGETVSCRRNKTVKRNPPAPTSLAPANLPAAGCARAR